MKIQEGFLEEVACAGLPGPGCLVQFTLRLTSVCSVPAEAPGAASHADGTAEP